MRSDSQKTTREPPSDLAAQIEQNVASVLNWHRRETEGLTISLRRVEFESRLIGRPGYLVGLLCVIALWIGLNIGARLHYQWAWDEPPFALLSNAMTFVSLMITTIVLIAQNRQAKVAQQHTHLDLQVNLLTEQKVTKLIHLMEELRQDLPMVGTGMIRSLMC